MTACLLLAKERGIASQQVEEIGLIHADIEGIITRGLSGELSEEATVEMLTQSDYDLQECWGFKKDAAYHTYPKKFLFLLRWVGRTFKCESTGERLTLTRDMVYERAFIPIGECHLDLGRFNAYSRRIGNLVEVFTFNLEG